MDKKSLRNTIIASAIILIGIGSRLIPHAPNFSPIESLTLLGGIYISRKYLALLLPVMALLVSDFILNNTINRIWFPNHEGLVFFGDYMITTLLAVVLIVLISQKWLKKVSLPVVAGGTLMSILIFWIVTNFGSWIGPMSLRPKTPMGLLLCYQDALPFLKSSLYSNAVFSIVAFGAIELLNKWTAKSSVLAEG